MFSHQQRRGALYFILITLVIVLIIDLAKRRYFSEDDKVEGEIVSVELADSTHLFDFDPNTATLKELRELGLGKREAVSIIRYRTAGKVFRIKEDLYECYGLNDSIYYAIEPYIKIGAEYQYKKRETSQSYNTEIRRAKTPLSKFLIDTVSVEYLHSTGVLSRRQAEVFVKWHKMSGMRDMEELRECYVISAEAAAKLEPYVIFPPRKEESVELVDINKADSAELRSVIGIGEKSVVAILEFREKLGGFYSCDQLSELKVVTESNFERIIKQISCDSCDISKIDINFAVAKKIVGHPYISHKALRRLLKIRQIKGGWSSIAEMTEDDIFNLEEAERVRPYLLFKSYTKL